MAKSQERNLKKLEAENKRLSAENKELQKKLSAKGVSVSSGSWWRSLGVALCVGLATALLVAGNVLFWTGNTVVKTDRYVEATAPLVRNAEVQNAVATKLSDELFKNVDVEQVVEDALPPRAAFAAPTLAEKIRENTHSTILKILQRPQFQDRWNEAHERAHARFIEAVKEHGSDGKIDISEVYSDVSEQLKDTKLAFLADKPLPDNIGEIEVASEGWLPALNKTINNIDAWRTVALILLLALSALGIWLSRNRRRTVIILSSAFAGSMFLTTVSARATREIVAGQVEPQYSEAVRQAYSTVMHPLAVQTFTLMALALVVALIAWISGPYRSSSAIRTKIDQLLSGKLHSVVFSKENGFTKWIGANKKVLQWLSVAIAAVAILVVDLTPNILATSVLAVVAAVLIIEVLAAPTKH